MNTTKLRTSAMAVGAVSLLALGYGFGSSAIGRTAPSTSTASSETSAPRNTVALPDFSSIVAQYGPAVVNVRVSGMMRTGAHQWHSPNFNFDENDPFSQFFRQFQQQMPQETPMHGIGSGFIVSSDGIILTNAHVVDGAEQVSVKLTDKREFQARVLGKDKATDIAVLKIDARNLPVVKIGDAGRERVGEWAVAIGAPFGFENTATAGIISAKARSLPNQGYVQFIQTDVPVNPGNSGGPLFNLNGEVVGINSQIYSGSGGYQGVSFAIPINLAMQVEQQLVKNGKVERGQLGVSIQSVDQSLAQSFGLKEAEGALISSVTPGGPGDKAGLQSGDVILKFNGQDVADAGQLPSMVGGVAPGDTVHLTVWRKGSQRDVQVKLGDANAGQTLATSAGEEGKARLGLAVRPLSSDERSQADVSGGLVVESVSGPAAKAGIEPGDIVLALNGQPVTSVSQLREQAAKAGHQIALLIQHDDARVFVPLDLG
ncbi:MAG TPA: Do family serine endopeptidase [Steroidobacteraceae bacterium]|jgi:serine protease Do|nr:Do family serine endopeptidase [Steroidobacteraceae bacterium]